MPTTYIKKSSGWSKINSIYIKKASGWIEILSVYLKKATGWVQVFSGAKIPGISTFPKVRDSFSNNIDNSTYVSHTGDTLYGYRGSWSNTPTAYTDKWQWASNSGGPYSDFSPAQTATTLTTSGNINAWDGRYVVYVVKATNSYGTSDWVTSSNEARLVKYAPSNNSLSITGNAEIGATLSISMSWASTYTNTNDQSPATYTYNWFYGDNNQSVAGTNGGSTYIINSSDSGHTIRVTVTATNTGGSTAATSSATSIVGTPLTISNVYFTDAVGRSGKNNRNQIVTATYTQLNWTANGVIAGTSYRLRYRIFNNQNSTYYSPSDPNTPTTDAASWLQFEDGTLSIATSGSTATISKAFNLNSSFNGSTYGGGISRWRFDYELSIINSGGTRKYWNYGDTMTTTQANDYWSIDPTSTTTMSADASTVNTSTAVTFTGSYSSYPSALTSYPHSYNIDYGDGYSSGWTSYAYGTSNPSYSQSHTYASTGSYTATIYTTPSYSTSSVNITVANTPVNTVLPTLSTDTTNYSAGSTITLNSGSWTGANSYTYELLYGSTNPVPTTNSTKSLINTNQYAITLLDARFSSYYFRSKITAWSGSSQTGASTIAYSTTSPISYIIPTCTTPTVSSETSSGFTIGWISGPTNYVASTADINIYNSSQSLVATISGVTNNTNGTASSYTWTGGSSGTTYYAKVKVYALDTSNTPVLSSFSSSIATSTATTAPTSFTSSTTYNDKITLDWSGGSGTSYEFYWASNNTTTPGTNPATFTTTNQSTYDWLAVRGSTYYLYIRAATGTTKSSWFPTSAPGRTGYMKLYAPPAPTSITSTGATSTSLGWYWDSPNPSSTEDYPSSWDYAISTSTATPTSWSNVTARPTSTTPLTTSGLSASTTYYMHVKAKNIDASASSTYGSGTTSAAPVASVSNIYGDTGGRIANNNWRDPKSTMYYYFSNVTSATARIQRSTDNVTWTSGATEILSVSGGFASQSTNQPTGATNTSGNYYYRAQVISMNGTTLATPITSGSFQNTATAKSFQLLY
jgi:hypothetical protein